MLTPMSPYLLTQQLISSYQHNCLGKSVNINFIGKFKNHLKKTFAKVSPNVEKSLNQAQPCVNAALQSGLNTAVMRDVACKGDYTAVKKCKNDRHNLSELPVTKIKGQRCYGLISRHLYTDISKS